MDKPKVLIITPENGSLEIEHLFNTYYKNIESIDISMTTREYTLNEDIYITVLHLQSTFFELIREIEGHQKIILLGNDEDFLIFSKLTDLFLYKKINFVRYERESNLTDGKREHLLNIIEGKHTGDFRIRAIIKNNNSDYSYESLGGYFYNFEKLENAVFPSGSSIEIKSISKGSLVQEIVGNLEEITLLCGLIYGFSQGVLSILSQGVKISTGKAEKDKIIAETKKIEEETKSLSIKNNDKLDPSEVKKFNDFMMEFNKTRKERFLLESDKENTAIEIPINAVNQIKLIDKKFPIEKITISLDSNNVWSEKDLGDIVFVDMEQNP